MRNIVIAFFVIISLIWLFFSTILLDSVDLNDAVSSANTHNKDVREVGDPDVDIKNLALFLNVEYKEEQVLEEIKITTFDIDVGVVVIYTSNDTHKARIRITADKKKTEKDMVIGDKLYDYEVIEINPSFVILDNIEHKIILKAFKDTVISVTDLPKDLPGSL
jgi:hypothetical protein